MHEVYKLTMYTDLCLTASLNSSFNSGNGFSSDLLTLVLSSLISKRPVFDFCRAEMMTLLSVVKDLSLKKEIHQCYYKTIKENKKHMTIYI